ncbi:HET-domain-containing protein, partial [Cadophora sp. DSE1049]
MRLLNTSNYILRDFTSSDIPKYAILSHRWEGQELTFQELQAINLGLDQSPQISDERGHMATGWSKIKGACTQAWKDGYEWIWIDSCCIDKTSSAELSEAINSMFIWYKNAEVCYAYLSDVHFDYTEYLLDNVDWSPDDFRSSKWFTRGWTLQELLAPRYLRFFSHRWADLGDRATLWPLVSDTTGIEDWSGFKTATIAQKMSWASRRETTRTEDRAYSLMGLFGVNMPPLYGEGENAFIRLQLEILRISDDESIFAWEDPKDDTGGLLARSPEAFRNSGDVRRLDNTHYEKPPYSMTNKGLRVE